MLHGLRLEDFTAFREADLKFSRLNVIHGENSTGKTHVLKVAYSCLSALCPSPNRRRPKSPTQAWLEPRLGAKLSGVFRPDQGRVGRLARRTQGTRTARVGATLDAKENLEFQFGTRADGAVDVTHLPDAWLDMAPVYLPTRELLSVYPGFVSLYETQVVPFDESWRDTCALLGAPLARGPRKAEIRDLLEPLEVALGARAILEGDRFYLQMANPRAKVEADLVAEGLRKLTMVARLIATGGLDDKGYLFWDEPEANLNPRLIRQLAPLLVDLSRWGVQVFLTTHSLFLMREIEIYLQASRRRRFVRFIGLHLGPEGVEVAQGPSLDDSGDIAALDESLQQSDRFLALE